MRHPRRAVALTTTAIRRMALAPLMGMVAGVILYLGNLCREGGTGPRPAFGCDKPAGYDVVNLPAEALAVIHRVNAVAPQQFGEYEDPRRSATWGAQSAVFRASQSGAPRRTTQSVGRGRRRVNGNACPLMRRPGLRKERPCRRGPGAWRRGS